MSRIEELKKQNPDFNFNIIEYLNIIFDKSKYVDLGVRLLKSKHDEKKFSNHEIERLKDDLSYWGINVEKLRNNSVFTLLTVARALELYFSRDEIRLITKFSELNEKKLISKSDLSKYKVFDDLLLEVSIAEMKLLGKELEKQIVKLYEDDEWLIIKPLSWDSSKKYGANTKWCTAMSDEPDYFYRYVRKGILIYSLNKKTGDKVAGFKALLHDERETSFWDIKDMRQDSMETNLPIHIIEIYRNEFTKKITNWDLLSEDEKQIQLINLETSRKNYIREDVPEPVPTPIMRVERYEEPTTEMANQINNELRNILLEELENISSNEAVVVPLYNGEIPEA